MTYVQPEGVVEFRFYRPRVKQVSVAGSFNDWRDGELPMRHAGDGWWIARAKLPAGEHRFRYVADGTWFTDYAAHGVEHDEGAWNSVLVVPGKARDHGRSAK